MLGQIDDVCVPKKARPGIEEIMGTRALPHSVQHPELLKSELHAIPFIQQLMIRYEGGLE